MYHSIVEFVRDITIGAVRLSCFVIRGLSWLLRTLNTEIQSISALAVGFVAVYGYFYTIVPLYSKAVLEEEKAKLEIKVEGLQKTAQALETDQQRLLLENSYFRDASSSLDRAIKRQEAVLTDLQRERYVIEKEFREYAQKNRRYVIAQALARARARADDLYRIGMVWTFMPLVTSDAPQSYRQLWLRESERLKSQFQEFPGLQKDIEKAYLNGRTVIKEAFASNGLTTLLARTDEIALVAELDSFIDAYKFQNAFADSLVAHRPAAIDLGDESSLQELRGRFRSTHEHFKLALDGLGEALLVRR